MLYLLSLSIQTLNLAGPPTGIVAGSIPSQMGFHGFIWKRMLPPAVKSTAGVQALTTSLAWITRVRSVTQLFSSVSDALGNSHLSAGRRRSKSAFQRTSSLEGSTLR